MQQGVTPYTKVLVKKAAGEEASIYFFLGVTWEVSHGESPGDGRQTTQLLWKKKNPTMLTYSRLPERLILFVCYCLSSETKAHECFINCIESTWEISELSQSFGETNGRSDLNGSSFELLICQ